MALCIGAKRGKEFENFSQQALPVGALEANRDLCLEQAVGLLEIEAVALQLRCQIFA